ncbi:uncharacterized protein LOC118746879 [Rhagoletis pomonella]|uniref:uncharacterized protein LOC118746879 n=1 Tax=Rhagoletis pomonella TaxID=28610 RepID=UPI00178515B4|nr:uncharacterized protein LOC118746879 [Rhagoletis pomonella]
MNSKLVLLLVFACLGTMVNARPQQWQGPIFSNPFFPNIPDASSTTTPAPPASSTTVPSPEYLACLRACPTTMEYNPVCGSDSQNYHNNARLDCAARCGQDVVFVRLGTCNAL